MEGEEHETLHARALGGLRELDRRLRIDAAVIVLRLSRHGMREACGMDHHVHVAQGGGHVLR
jgi:hypothetical protein